MDLAEGEFSRNRPCSAPLSDGVRPRDISFLWGLEAERGRPWVPTTPRGLSAYNSWRAPQGSFSGSLVAVGRHSPLVILECQHSSPPRRR